VREVRPKSNIIACTVAADSPYNLYTVPLNCRSKVILLNIINAGAASKAVDVKWYRKSEDTSYFILGDKSIAAGGVFEFLSSPNGYIILEPEDRLDVTISADGTIDVVCTIEEIFTGNITNT